MTQKMSGQDKAAILLMTLGEDTASEIMKRLDPKDLRRIGGMISKLSSVSQEDVDAVLQEFSEQAGDGIGLSIEGKEYIQNVLTKALGSEKATRVIETLSASEEGGLETLKWMDSKAIANMIRSEHPQTIALILTYLDPSQSGEVLIHLQDALRGDVMVRMATLEDIPPGAIKEIGEAIQTGLSVIGTTSGRKVSGVKLVADILNQMGPSAEQGVLALISQNRPELAEQIRQLMFVFDDLAQLDDRAMQEVLKEVNKEQLAVALRAVKEELKEKIFRNMSSRAVEILKEDMEAKGPVKLSDVEKSQQAILKIAQRLAEEGKIVIGGKGTADAMV